MPDPPRLSISRALRPDCSGLLACALLCLLPAGAWASPSTFAAQAPFLGVFLASLAVFAALRGLPRGAADPDPLLFPLWIAGCAVVASLAAALAMQQRLPGISPPRWPLVPPASPALLAVLDVNDAAAVAAMLLPPGLVLLAAQLRGRGAGQAGNAPLAPRLLRAAVVAAGMAALAALLWIALARGAMIAAAAGCALTLALLGRRGRIVLGLLLAVALAAVAAAGFERVTDAFLLPGRAAGFSADHVLSNRLAVWDRTLFLLRDFGAAGIGLGAFSSLLPALYPLPAVLQETFVPDAHNALLQSMADFGAAGPLLLLALALAALWRALRRARPGDGGRTEGGNRGAAAVAGSLAAFLVAGLTEALGAGTPGSAALFVLLALASRLPGRPPAGSAAPLAEAPEAATVEPVPRWRPWRIAVALLPAGLTWALILFPAASPFSGAAAARDCARAALHRAPVDERAADGDAGWLLGQARAAAGDTARRDAAWSALIARDPAYLRLAAEAAPLDRPLAEAALRRHPVEADALFWLASMLRAADTARAVALYGKGLAVRPGDGLRWFELGRLLEQRDRRAAMRAYLESCRNGDPGANGCLHAGRSAEALADTASAIACYRLSRYAPARRRADELEAALRAGGQR